MEAEYNTTNSPKLDFELDAGVDDGFYISFNVENQQRPGEGMEFLLTNRADVEEFFVQVDAARSAYQKYQRTI